MDVSPPPTAEEAERTTEPPDTLEMLETLFHDGEALVKQVSGICEESADLLREEFYLAIAGITIGARWLAVAAIALGTSWFCINAAAVAAVVGLGMHWGYAALVVSIGNAALAWYAHELASRHMADITFPRTRRLMKARS